MSTNGFSSSSLHRAIDRGLPGQRSTAWRLSLVGVDLLVVVGMLFFALMWNLGRGPSHVPDWAFIAVAVMQLITFQAAGAYDMSVPGSPAKWMAAVLPGHASLLIILMVVTYISGASAEVPRLAFTLWAVASLVILLSCRALLAVLCRRFHGKALADRVVLVGSAANCEAVCGHLRLHPELGYEVVGIVTDQELFEELPHAPLDQLSEFTLEWGATEVFICAKFGDEELINGVHTALVDYPVGIHLVPSLHSFPLFCLRIDDLAGRPALSLSASPLSPRDELVKRIEDVLGSFFILLCIWPVLALVAIGVRLFNGPGPIFFAQNRHGLMGRTIVVYKFRTMTWSPAHIDEITGQNGFGEDSGARSAREQFLNPETGLFNQVKSNDARVTTFGKFLRSSSLDELPQFWNVLRGDMSIVGPRPHARRHNLEYVGRLPNLMRRHFVKPGITGLAQISGARGRTVTDEDMARRLSFDLAYISSWSLWLDLQIIVKTVFVGFVNREP